MRSPTSAIEWFKRASATWQRCRVHFMRNALAFAGKGQRQVVLALINTAFAQDTAEAAIEQWSAVSDQLRGKFPKLSAYLVDQTGRIICERGSLSPPSRHRFSCGRLPL
jgi:putative transposase